MEVKNLVEKVDSIIDNINPEDFNKETFDDVFIEPLNNKKGVMVFDDYDETFIDQKYPYKRRYYYVEKLDNDNTNKKIIFVLFNCSTSNPEELDNTVKNCKSLAQKNKYSQIEVLNLFSIRNPKVKNIDDNDISHNNKYEIFNFAFINALLNKRKEDTTNEFDVVLAWGYGKKNPSYNRNKNKIIEKRIDDMEKFCNEFLSENIKFKKLSVNIKNATSNIVTKDRHPGNQAWSEFGNFLDVAELTEYDFKK